MENNNAEAFGKSIYKIREIKYFKNSLSITFNWTV